MKKEIIENLDGEIDPNVVAYDTLKVNREWVKKHRGNWVAFVGAQVVLEDSDFRQLLKRLNEEYPNKSAFLQKVGEERTLPVDSVLR